MASLADLRKDYTLHGLLEHELAPCPFDQFAKWFGDAVNAKVTEPNAMTVSTLGLDGFPRARVVYWKELIEEGIVFYTNYSNIIIIKI